MQLTPTTFSNLDENLEIRQQAAVRAANGNRFGRLADTAFCADGVFVQGNFEVPELKCLAVLPSGCLISPDEPASVRFPRMSDGMAYLAVSLGMDMLEYEREGVTYVRHSYSYEILTLAEIIRLGDVMPLVRFRIENNRCSIDKDFVPPCLMFASDEKLVAWHETITTQLETIACHANMKEGDGKQTLMRYLFRLRAFDKRRTLDDFLLLLSEIVQAVRFFVIQANGAEYRQLDDVCMYDVQLWLSQVKEYFVEASHILDGVELKDETIDFEALKAQLRTEIYEMLQPEMKNYVDDRMREMNDAIQQRLSEVLRDYIDGTFRQQLEDALKISISETLSPELYDKLYKALYDALFVPQSQEEDNFMPLI